MTIMEFKCALSEKKKIKVKTARHRHEISVHIGSIERECQSCGNKMNKFDRLEKTCQKLTMSVLRRTFHNIKSK